MNNWIMMINNQVIDIIYQTEEPPNWPPDEKGNPVNAIPWEDTSNIEIGQIYENGKFIDKIIEEEIEEIFEEISEENINDKKIFLELQEIKNLLKIDQEKIREEAIDAFTKEMIANGIL